MTNTLTKPQNESGSRLRAVPASSTAENRKTPSTDSVGALPCISLPHVVAEWPKNSRETIRVSLGEYAGKPNCDVRIWYEAKDGSLKPSPKGVTVGMEQQPRLVEALAQASTTAQAVDWLEGGDA